MNKNLVLPLLVVGCMVLSNSAWADMAVMKAYKQAFPGAQTKCNSCHVDNLPKKAEGQHDWNAYGKALKKAINDAGVADVATADDTDKISEAVKKVGKIEDFKE